MAAEFCTGDACGGTTGGLSTHTSFWGGTDTTSYKILFLLHMLAIIAAFGPVFLYPLISRIAKDSSGDGAMKIAMIPYDLIKRMFLPALLSAMVFGILLTADSSKVYEMSKGWVSGAFTVVIAIALIAWFLLRPAQKRFAEGLSAGSDGAEKVRSAKATIAASTGLIHLGLIVIIVLMVWKPGQYN